LITRVLHVSDLHVGRRDSPEAHEALVRLAERVDPELVVASGDLAHRGRRDQLEQATELLRSLGRPVLAVPGNHDIPYTFPARFTKPWAEFERLWETTEPVYRGERVFVVGLNSVRPWRHQSGRLTPAQLVAADRLFDEAPEGALRIAVLHHHLLGAPWRSRKKPVAKRNEVLARLVESGAELILAGHIHQSTVSERREFEVSTPGGERAVVISIAPGLGQPRPQRRGEARGLHVYEGTDESLTVRSFIWREDGWGLTAVRTFPRGRDPLAFEPEPQAAQR
jgi:3',5'-cyclic AMP phosphodiesterase CpdA